MRLPNTLFALFASTLAVPTPASDANVLANIKDAQDVSLTETGDAKPISIRQDLQCDWDGFCGDAFQNCVKTCDSLRDSDW